MSDFSLSEINERISRESEFIDIIRDEISTVVFGQKDLINRLLIGILANGHILIEGVPDPGDIFHIYPLFFCINTVNHA